MDLQPAQQTFLTEGRDLLQEMESALLVLEAAPADGDAVNAVFRAAHTLKGSAGLFDYAGVVALTHAMEGVLEELRAGHLAPTGELVALLLACGDRVAATLERIAAGETAAAPEEEDRALIERLGAAMRPGAGLPCAAGAAEPEVESLGSAPVASETWHISLRFGREVLRNGMDPLSLLHYLGTLGEVVSVGALFDAMPEAAHMDPECCYLGLELDFAGAVDKKALEDAFEFVRDDCAVRILPPHSRIADYIELIGGLPEDAARLGEMLVASGALTRRELEAGLRLQRAQRAAGDAAATRARIGEILVSQGVVPDAVVDAALGKQRTNLERRSAGGSLVRVRADKLDELIDLVGELVIASAGAGLVAHRSSVPELVEAVSTMERLVEQVRDGALTLRMVPIGETFARFGRVVRDLGRELGKEVALEVSGTETELDKSMVERITDPLMHLVRNALDHGIEPAAARAARGKPARGLLRLNAYPESGSIVIEVSDDGGGLDRERILARAVERGLAAPGQALSDRDVFRLVMEPGFSTAAQVTSVSGRGVGMDVVRRNIEALRGSVAIDSVPGAGTTVAMRLPLTLAIIDGFLVRVGRGAYVIPLEVVAECLELPATEAAAIRETGYINLRGEVLPLLRLRDLFEVRAEPCRDEKIVVVRYGPQQAGLVVDALLDELQAVIKPLGRLFERLSGVAGSTILGNGEVALILDVQELVQRAVGAHARTGIEAMRETPR